MVKGWASKAPEERTGRRAFVKAAFFVYAYKPEANWLDPCVAALLATRAGDGLEEERAYLLHSLGHALAVAARLADAERLMAHEVPQLEPAKPAYWSWVLFTRGMLRKLQGLPVQALEDYEAASKIPDPTGGQLAGSLQVELAGVYLELGLPDRATRQLGAREDLPAQLQRTRIELYSGRRSAALRRVEAALPLAADEEWNVEREQLKLQKAIGLAEQGSFEEARVLLASLADSATLSQVERMEARLQRGLMELRAGNIPAARTELHRSGSVPLTPLQKVRWATLRAQWERLRGANREELLRARTELERAQAEFFRLWAETPILESGVGFLQYDIRRATLGEHIALDMVLEDAQTCARRALDLMLRAQLLGTLARQWQLKECTLDEVRAKLVPEGGGLLLLLPSPGASHLLALDAGSLTHHQLPESMELEAAQRRFSRAIMARPQGDELQEWQAACEAFAAVHLPAQVRELISRWKGLVTVGFDSFGFTPLEALSLDGKRLLGEELDMHSLPSIPVGLELKRRLSNTRPPVRRALLAPSMDSSITQRWSGLVPIPWSDADTQALRGALGSIEWTLLVGEAANRAAFLAPGEELILLTHGVEDLERDPPAGLILAGSADPLFSADISTWATPPRLALLAACGARRAVVRRGDEGLNHIGGALHIAGVPTVIASAADLDYEASRELLLAFCRERSTGATIARALRQARRQLGATARFAHPYYRALLVASGPSDW